MSLAWLTNIPTCFEAFRQSNPSPDAYLPSGLTPAPPFKSLTTNKVDTLTPPGGYIPVHTPSIQPHHLTPNLHPSRSTTSKIRNPQSAIRNRDTSRSERHTDLIVLAQSRISRLSSLRSLIVPWMALPSSRNQRWEPRAIRGRLRHCNGLQSSKATGSLAEPGRRKKGSKPGSQDIRLVISSSGPAHAGPLLRHREG
jgi:hypothetical protein